MTTFTNKHFLKLLDFTPAEIDQLLDLAADLKAKKKAGIPHRLCEGKSIALIFEKTSTRTRCAFEVAAADLVCTRPIWIPPALSWAKRKASPIPPGFWAGCTTALSTGATVRKL